MSHSDRKAVYVLSVLRVITELIPVMGSNNVKCLQIIDDALTCYSGKLSSREQERLTARLTHIFTSLVEQKFEVTSDVICCLYLYFSDYFLVFTKFDKKIDCWENLKSCGTQYITRDGDQIKPYNEYNATGVIEFITKQMYRYN